VDELPPVDRTLTLRQEADERALEAWRDVVAKGIARQHDGQGKVAQRLEQRAWLRRQGSSNVDELALDAQRFCRRGSGCVRQHGLPRE
jgi:hypothetical protein